MRHVAAIALVIALCAPVLCIRLGDRDSTHTMENVALVVSQETWLRNHAGELDDPLITTNNFMPRYAKPPLVAWMNMIAWFDLDPEIAHPTELLLRARLVSVSMALILLASTYWLGVSFGGKRAGLIASLAAGSMIFLQHQARTASYDIHAGAWLTLAVACAIWGIRPRSPQSPHRVWPWFVPAGIALGLAVLAKNPLPVLLAMIPIGAVAMSLPSRRKEALQAAVIMSATAAFVAGPWYLHVVSNYEHAFTKLTSEFRQSRIRDDQKPFYYYATLLIWLLPWTPWVISGLIHPFMPASRHRRRVQLIPWLWFVGVLMFFSIPAAKVQRYVFPIVPAAAILLALVWRDHDESARRKDGIESAGNLVHIHWIALLIASIAMSGFMGWQREIITWLGQIGNMPESAALIVEPLSPLAAAVVGIILCALALAGWREHRRDRPCRAGVVTALWSCVAMGTFWWGYAGADSGVHPIRSSAEGLRSRIGESPLVRYVPTWPDPTDELNEEFRFYLGRLIHPMSFSELQLRQNEADRLYVLAPDESKIDEAIAHLGLERLDLVQVDKHQQLRVWRESE